MAPRRKFTLGAAVEPLVVSAPQPPKVGIRLEWLEKGRDKSKEYDMPDPPPARVVYDDHRSYEYVGTNADGRRVYRDQNR